MTKRIDEFVSENRQSVKRLDATFIPVSGESSSSYTFGNNQFEIETEVRVYTRSLNGGLISGHPSGETYGSGHGESGDFRGAWTLVEDVENSQKFVTDGRNIVAEGLAGEDGAVIGQLAVGDGTTSASVNDSTLESQSGKVFAWPKPGTDSNESTAEAVYLFSEYGDTVSEFGALSRNDDLYNRITTDALNPSNEEELRVEVDFTVTGQTTGSSVITDHGKDRVADSLRAIDTPVGLAQLVFGTGSSSPSVSDTTLDNQVLAKNCQRILSAETVTANTVVFTIEPDTQPHDIAEIGVVDTNGTLFWRTVVEPFEKDDNTEFTTNVTFRIK